MKPAPESIAKLKEPYETPRLTHHGTVEEITRQLVVADEASGSGLDAVTRVP